MGFTKQKNEPSIRIEVRHNWHPAAVFAFTFPKRMPKLAADSEARFLGLTEAAREDEHRQAIIEVVSEMVTQVEGFDDFPADEVMPENLVARSLAERFRAYFDDPSQAELEQIVVGAWRAYRASAMPSAYPKSFQADGAGDS